MLDMYFCSMTCKETFHYQCASVSYGPFQGFLISNLLLSQKNFSLEATDVPYWTMTGKVVKLSNRMGFTYLQNQSICNKNYRNRSSAFHRLHARFLHSLSDQSSQAFRQRFRCRFSLYETSLGRHRLPRRRLHLQRLILPCARRLGRLQSSSSSTIEILRLHHRSLLLFR
jgi:hypothetical protein